MNSTVLSRILQCCSRRLAERDVDMRAKFTNYIVSYATRVSRYRGDCTCLLISSTLAGIFKFSRLRESFILEV